VVYRKTLTLSRELASELSYLEQEAASVLSMASSKNSRKSIPQQRRRIPRGSAPPSLDNLDPFKEREGEGEHDEETPDGLPKPQAGPERDPFRVYGVQRNSCARQR